jgi:hypothetical protein
MKYIHFLLAVLVSLLSALPAQAETACKSLDSVLNTVSVVRDIEADPKEAIQDIYLSDLSARMEVIALPALIPMKERDAFPAESAAILQYISTLREAVAGAQGGYDAYARQIFSQSVSVEFLQSLKSLETYWGCNAEAKVEALGEAVGLERADYFGVVHMSADIEGAGVERSALNTSQERGLLSSGQTISQVAFLPVKVKQASLAIFMLLGVLMLIGGFYFHMSRLKNFEVREHRRALRLPVRVRIDNAERAVLIMDISMNGAKIKHSNKIEEKSVLHIHLGDTWHLGQVRWSNNYYAGVKFKVPIDPKAFEGITQIIDASG